MHDDKSRLMMPHPVVSRKHKTSDDIMFLGMYAWKQVRKSEYHILSYYSVLSTVANIFFNIDIQSEAPIHRLVFQDHTPQVESLRLNLSKLPVFATGIW